jgi:hydroxysqualene synthase
MTAAVETPSGKGAGDENFPVGSLLLPARLRPHIALFYRFARAIDDIADNPALAPAEKLRRLDLFERTIDGAAPAAPGLETAERLRQSLNETGIDARHCRDLIAAFKLDAVKSRYADWGELMSYCALSAAPVGRYLLDLHGEDAAGYRWSDALCAALQVLNHLQDCQDDYRTLDRVYLPGDWMAEAGMAVADLDAAAASTPVRLVLDRALAGIEGLMGDARALPAHLGSRRLAMESAVIAALADRLAGRLRRNDPLAGRVALTRGDFLRAGLTGMIRGMGRRQPAR